MNIQSLNLVTNINFLAKEKRHNVTSDLHISKPRTASIYTRAKVENEAKIKADLVIVKSLNKKYNDTAYEIQGNAKTALEDVKIIKRNAAEIYSEIKRALKENNVDESNATFVFSLNDGRFEQRVQILNGLCVVYEYESNSDVFDRYEIDFKTGKLFAYRKDCKIFNKGQEIPPNQANLFWNFRDGYCANEEYFFNNEKLTTYNYLTFKTKNAFSLGERFLFDGNEKLTSYSLNFKNGIFEDREITKADGIFEFSPDGKLKKVTTQREFAKRRTKQANVSMVSSFIGNKKAGSIFKYDEKGYLTSAIIGHASISNMDFHSEKEFIFDKNDLKTVDYNVNSNSKGIHAKESYSCGGNCYFKRIK